MVKGNSGPAGREEEEEKRKAVGYCRTVLIHKDRPSGNKNQRLKG